MPLEQQLIGFVLLLLAIAIGWWLGYRTARRKHKASKPAHGLSKDYLRGLSLLLNDDTDQAIEVFLELFAADQETVETHLALGSLYRRRGETERAIRIHQNLVARPELPSQYREQALFELAEDYMRAGVLDRAEHMYRSLLEHDPLHQAALKRLLRIFEQQREWDTAIDIANRLERVSDFKLADQRAHYHCEIADRALSQQPIDRKDAERQLRRALASEPDNIRANLMMAQRAEAMDNARLAAHHYQRVIDLDMRFAVEVFDALERNFAAVNELKAYQAYLKDLARREDSAVPRILLAMQMYRADDVVSALDYVGDYLDRDATLVGVAHILKFMVELVMKRQQTKMLNQGGLSQQQAEQYMPEGYAQLQTALQSILDKMHRYRCTHCGFTSRNLSWQCTSCKQWSTTVPVRDSMAPHQIPSFND